MATKVTKQSVTVKDVPASELVKAYAAHLKREGKLEVPKWVDLVKTSNVHELGPLDADWFYVRAASILRRLYLRSAGVKSFRVVYGKKSNPGGSTGHHVDANASIIRKALQALEKLQLVEKAKVKGRKLTPKGRAELDRIAGQVFAEYKPEIPMSL